MTHMNLSKKKTDSQTENRIVVHKGEGGGRMHWNFEISR